MNHSFQLPDKCKSEEIYGHLDSSERPPVKTGVKNLQGGK